MAWRRWIATCFGLGWLPVAPGTWGSLPPAVVFGVLTYSDVSHAVTMIVMAVMAVAGVLGCLCCASASVAAAGKKDPGEVVMDEFAGQALTFLAIPLLLPRFLSGVESFLFALAGFLLFRVLDIVKPGPIRKLESLPGSVGILMDDLASGVVSAIILSIAVVLLVRV
jgi:phosphatidylglycerophosphatase A